MHHVPKFALRRLQTTTPTAGSHPDANLLTAFAERSLAGREHEIVMEHLAACGNCRQLVAIALPETEVMAARAVVRSGGFCWPVLRWGTLAAGIFLIVSLGIVVQHRQRGMNAASNLEQKGVPGAPARQPSGNSGNAGEIPAAQSVPTGQKFMVDGSAHVDHQRGRDREEGGTELISENRPSDLPIRNHSTRSQSGQAASNSDISNAKDPVAEQAAPPRWTITAAGALHRSFDGGKTWEDVNPTLSTNSAGNSSLFLTVAAGGLEVWAGGSGGLLLHTADGGNHWARIFVSNGDTTLTGDITNIQFTDLQHGKLATSTGEQWNTYNAGQSWQKP
ncbi:MAG: YCF48-related protein [Candidatus Sulfotelmatobacter sp.]